MDGSLTSFLPKILQNMSFQRRLESRDSQTWVISIWKTYILHSAVIQRCGM